MIHVIPSVIIVIFAATFGVWIARIVRVQRATWREWCERPQVRDDEFLDACGVPHDERSRKLALAARTALAEVSGVPPGTINAGDSFRHQFWDSLDWLDVTFRIEKAAVVKIPGGCTLDVLRKGRDEAHGAVVADLVRAVLASAQGDVTTGNRKTASPV